MTFLNSLLNNSKEHSDPFQHWELNEPLSIEAIKEINTADIANVVEHNLSYDGTRAIDGGGAEFREGIASGGKAIKFRCFITKENANEFPGLVKFINDLQYVNGVIQLKNATFNDYNIGITEDRWQCPMCEFENNQES